MDEVIESRAKELSLKGYKPKYLAVDEFAVHKGHTYATCVMDLEEGDVIWVGSGRAIKDFKKFFEEILHSHESVAICYAMKEEITRLYELKDEKEAEEGWTNWFKAAKESNITQLVKFAELKEKRLPGLIAHAKYRIGTGRLEGFNNKIKVAKRIGYGYRNDEHFFTMIKYLSISKRHKLSPIKM